MGLDIPEGHSYGIAGAPVSVGQPPVAGAAFAELSYASTVTIDWSEAECFAITLIGNCILGNPINPTVGQTGKIIIRQDGVGGRTLAYGPHWTFDGGTPAVPNNPNEVTVFDYIIESSERILVKPWAGSVVTPPLITRYVVVEIGRPISGGGSVVREIQFFDENDDAITWTTTVDGVYDSRSSPDGHYWTSSIWDRTNLHDGNTTYGSGSALFGCYLCTGAESIRIRIDFGFNRTIRRWKCFMGAGGTSGSEKPILARLYACATDPQTVMRAGNMDPSWQMVAVMDYVNGVADSEQEVIL